MHFLKNAKFFKRREERQAEQLGEAALFLASNKWLEISSVDGGFLINWPQNSAVLSSTWL